MLRAVTSLASTSDHLDLNGSDYAGVLNYRTGRLDDGNDPYGWYASDD